jgi:hypothetical protein
MQRSKNRGGWMLNPPAHEQACSYTELRLAESLSVLLRVDKAEDQVMYVSRCDARARPSVGEVIHPIIPANQPWVIQIRVSPQVSEVEHRHLTSREVPVVDRLLLDECFQSLCHCELTRGTLLYQLISALLCGLSGQGCSCRRQRHSGSLFHPQYQFCCLRGQQCTGEAVGEFRFRTELLHVLLKIELLYG